MSMRPPVWSDSIVANFSRLVEWCGAIEAMCTISSNNYSLLMTRRACQIDDDALEKYVVQYSPNFGLLLDWIHGGMLSINSDRFTPDMCRLRKPTKLLSYNAVWSKHVCGEYQDLQSLNRYIKKCKGELLDKLNLFETEESDSYSSYSDYSEETSSSEEEGTESHKAKRKSSARNIRHYMEDSVVRRNLPYKKVSPRSEESGEESGETEGSQTDSSLEDEDESKSVCSVESTSRAMTENAVLEDDETNTKDMLCVTDANEPVNRRVTRNMNKK